ncbi:PAS domain S-box protein [Ancylothrix sp. C2]|uniref:PAS domain S-box protein n=1 Tax=Ancylothrix sp. D3o TaxID=2953691 RepID=UPI0021BB4AB4|nr:PAS domain S-box protein [Ancylothrix sp. D3o]MCT7953333.1 PAS domain S-box protein [Ancylothrix sp. D3o]
MNLLNGRNAPIYSNLLKNMRIGGWCWDLQRKHLELLGIMHEWLPPEGSENLLNILFGMVHPEDYAVAEQLLSFNTISGSEEIEFRVFYQEAWHTLIGSSQVFYEGHTPRFIVGMVSDITTTKLSQEALIASEAKWRMLVQNSTDTYLILDETYSICYASTSVKNILGEGEDVVVRKKLLDWVCWSDRAAVLKALQLLSGSPDGESMTIEFCVQNNQGEKRYLEAVISNCISNPYIAGITLNCRDVTQRFLAQQKLAESEAINASLIKAVPDILIRLDREGRYIDFISPSGKTPYLPLDKIIGQPLTAVLPAEVAARAMDAINDARITGTPQKMVYSLEENSKRYHYEARITMTDNTEILVIIRDITDEAQLKEQFLKHKNLLQAVVDRTDIILYAIDTDGIFTLSEGKGLEKLGLQPGEVVGKSVFNLYKDYPDVFYRMKEGLQGRSAQWISKIENHVYSSVAQPIVDDNGVVRGVVGFSIEKTSAYHSDYQLKESIDSLKREQLKTRLLSRLAISEQKTLDRSLLFEIKNALDAEVCCLLDGGDGVSNIETTDNFPAFLLTKLEDADEASNLAVQFQQVDANLVRFSKLSRQAKFALLFWKQTPWDTELCSFIHALACLLSRPLFDS